MANIIDVAKSLSYMSQLKGVNDSVIRLNVLQSNWGEWHLIIILICIFCLLDKCGIFPHIYCSDLFLCELCIYILHSFFLLI